MICDRPDWNLVLRENRIRRMAPILGPFSLDRMVRAVERVRERLVRATAALEKAGIPYAVAGGNAVAVWVTRVDATWCPRYPDELAARLQGLIDTPGG